MGCAVALLLVPFPVGARPVQTDGAAQAGSVSVDQVALTAMATGGTLVIERTSGNIRITAWDRPSVSIRVTARAKAAIGADAADAARQALGAFAVRIDPVSSSQIRLTARAPNAAELKRFGGRRGIVLTYTVQMPRTASLVLRHRVGSVDVVGVASNVEVEAGVGDVRIATALDPATAVTASAKIGEVRIPRHPGDAAPAPRQALLGQLYRALEVAPRRRQVVARIGIGSVEIEPMPKADTLGDAARPDLGPDG